MNGNGKKYTIMLMILLAVVFYAGASYSRLFDGVWDGKAPVEKTIAVYVRGAITHTGYYEMPASSRLNDLLKENPPLDNADLDGINTARFLVDGESIFIPYLPETKDEAAQEGKININTASLEQLITLKGIGETKARAIITYRENHNGFKRINDIKKVSGIGDKTYINIKDYICVD